MKNLIKFISLSLLLIFVFASCAIDESNVVEDIKITKEELAVENNEKIVAENTEAQEEEDEPRAIGGYSELNRQFIDPVNDIHYVIDLRGEEVYDWSDKVYNAMPRETRHSLPPLYWAIKEFDVTKEELISVKDPKLTLDIIDALYLEEEDMKKALASDLALVYDGDVYCYYDIMGLWGDEASKSMKSSLKKAIPESVKKDYAEKMKAYFIEVAGESYYNKIYKPQLESFSGVILDSEKVTE